MANSNSFSDALSSYMRRFLNILTMLVDMHLDIAIQEANYEKRRLIGGFIMLGIGIGLITMGVLLLQVLGILFVHWLGLGWAGATIIITGTNFLFGVAFLILASSRLRGPVMSQTQARLARSMALLRTRERS
ncbi:MAG: phage holin family protein [Leptolyngbyaceae cyanobacterium SM2_5_2]|nr:phage holin family protein [Leptolyngbyaceae cyanobacterium SM2_5_2]